MYDVKNKCTEEPTNIRTDRGRFARLKKSNNPFQQVFIFVWIALSWAFCFQKYTDVLSPPPPHRSEFLSPFFSYMRRISIIDHFSPPFSLHILQGVYGYVFHIIFYIYSVTLVSFSIARSFFLFLHRLMFFPAATIFIISFYTCATSLWNSCHLTISLFSLFP